MLPGPGCFERTKSLRMSTIRKDISPTKGLLILPRDQNLFTINPTDQDMTKESLLISQRRRTRIDVHDGPQRRDLGALESVTRNLFVLTFLFYIIFRGNSFHRVRYTKENSRFYESVPLDISRLTSCGL